MNVKQKNKSLFSEKGQLVTSHMNKQLLANFSRSASVFFSLFFPLIFLSTFNSQCNEIANDETMTVCSVHTLST